MAIVSKYKLTQYDKATTNTKDNSNYYSKYTGRSMELDKILKAIGVPAKYYGTYNKRKPIAKANGIDNYTGSYSQNIKLIDLAKKGKLKKV